MKISAVIALLLVLAALLLVQLAHAASSVLTIIVGATTSPTISAVSLNGGTTGTFTSPPAANTSVGPITPTCSNSTCAGIVNTLAASGSVCNVSNSANNSSFYLTSADGSSVTAPAATTLITTEGTWSFGALSSDGTDYNINLNGVTVGGALVLQMTNGSLYAHNVVNGNWYKRSGGSFAVTTTPVEAASPASQTLMVNAGLAAGTYKVCDLASSVGYSNSPQGVALTITGTGSTSISSLLMNGGTTGSFGAPSTAPTAIAPVTPTCSNGTCAGISVALATSGSVCNGTNGAGNGSFYMTSADGSIVTEPATTTLFTAEGTFAFGTLASGTDYNIKINGTNNGTSHLLQITNGILYAFNAGNGTWYYRANSTWYSNGSTAPVEGTGPTPQTLVVNSGVNTGTYAVCALASGSGYSNSPQGVALTVTGTSVSQTIASITTLTSGGTTFTANAANAAVGPPIVVTMNPPSPAFAGTLAITGTNTCSLHLVLTQVEAGPTGCAPGVVSGWNIVATPTNTNIPAATQAEAATAVVTVTGSCGTSGQAAADAAAAGYNTCALFNDFTASTGANWVPSFSGSVATLGNWLNCSGNDVGAVWNDTGTVAPCPGAYSQVNDGGTLAWQLRLRFSDLRSGQTDIVWPSTMPNSANSANYNLHVFGGGYFEWTYRWRSDIGNFNEGGTSGDVQGFYQWQCGYSPGNYGSPLCTGGGPSGTFVDLEVQEDWATGGTHADWGEIQWLNNLEGSYVAPYYPPRSGGNSVYHTVGALLTGNMSSYSVCTYVDGVRIQCDEIAYQSSSNITQRRQLILWNGITCGAYDYTDISCIPNFGNSDLLIQNIKVLTCAADVSGGACVNNTNNGSFFVP